MIVKTNNYILYFLITAIILSLCYFLINIATPFLAAAVLAYILNPIVEILQIKLKLSRNLIVSIVFVVFLTILIVAALLLMPIIYKQAALLIANIPVYKATIQNFIESNNSTNNLENSINHNIKHILTEIINSWILIITHILNHAWQYTITTIHSIVTAAFTGILLFYFLRDWKLIINSCKSILPQQSILYINKIVNSINTSLLAYAQGQLNICLILSIFYSISLLLINLDFSLTIGLFSGTIIIIPLIGTIISTSIALITCFSQFGLSFKLLYVSMIYIISHILESHFLTPKLIGSKVGLHPIWIYFAVLTCSYYLGFTGIFLAIPLAIIIKIVCQTIIDTYKLNNFNYK